MPAPSCEHDLGWFSDPGSAWGGGKLPPVAPDLCINCHEAWADPAHRWGNGHLCCFCQSLVCPDCHDALKHTPEAQRCVACEAEKIMQYDLVGGGR